MIFSIPVDIGIVSFIIATGITAINKAFALTEAGNNKFEIIAERTGRLNDIEAESDFNSRQNDVYEAPQAPLNTADASTATIAQPQSNNTVRTLAVDTINTSASSTSSWSLPALPKFAFEPRNATPMSDDTDVNAVALREAQIEALEMQTGMYVALEPSTQRLSARRHPRYKAYLGAACRDLRIRYTNGTLTPLDTPFPDGLWPEQHIWIAALDAQIRRACLADPTRDTERRLRVLRHRLARIYTTCIETDNPATRHLLLRFVDDYLPNTVAVFQKAQRTATNADAAEALLHEFQTQIRDLCTQFDTIVSQTAIITATEQRANGFFIKELTS